MNDPRRLQQHALIYGAGAVALQAANLLLMPLYTYYLDAAEYGVLQMIYRVGEVFHVCLMVQAVKLATFNLFGSAADAETRSRTAASVSIVTFGAMLVAGAAIIISGGWLVDRFPQFNDATFLICGVLTIMLQSLTMMPIAMMQARYESIPYVCSTVGIAVCHVAFSALGVAVLGWGRWGVIFSLALTHGVFGIGLTLRELGRTSFRPDLGQVRRFMKFSAPMIPVGVLSIAMHQGDQFFLWSFGGAAAVGVYALAYRIAQALDMFTVEPLSQIWNPWIYRVYRTEQGPVLLGRAITGILGVYLFFGLGFVILRSEIIGLLPNDYQRAADYVPVLVLGFFFMAANTLTDASYFVTSKTGRRTIVVTVSAGIMLGLYATLIPRYGGMGAAYSTLIGFATNYGLNLLVAQRAYRIQYEARRLTVLLSTAGGVTAAASQLGSGWVWIVPKAALWLAWPTLLWGLGFITQSEKLFLRDLLHRIPWLGTRVAATAGNFSAK